MSLPLIHSIAPDFNLADQDGTMHGLSESRGTWVLLYFYPKDDTPGCTTQACALEESFPSFTTLNAVAFGISVDSVKSHKKFAEKYGLTFPLLADEDKSVVNAYGVWGVKKFMGREYMGTSRTSFLINPEGKIAKVYENVKPDTHAALVLADLKEFQSI
jgi:peroxiredoxin Q/BCP